MKAIQLPAAVWKEEEKRCFADLAVVPSQQAEQTDFLGRKSKAEKKAEAERQVAKAIFSAKLEAAPLNEDENPDFVSAFFLMNKFLQVNNLLISFLKTKKLECSLTGTNFSGRKISPLGLPFSPFPQTNLRFRARSFLFAF